MSVKTTGLEWKRYYADNESWPEGAYQEDVEILINGLDGSEMDLTTIPDSATVELKSGSVTLNHNTFSDITEHFAAWRKRQTTDSGIFEAPKDKMEAIKIAIVAAGGVLIEK